MISKQDLQVGKRYVCEARNFTIGIWNGESFDYIRTKWGHRYWDREFHWEDGPPHGTVEPLKIHEGETDDEAYDYIRHLKMQKIGRFKE